MFSVFYEFIVRDLLVKMNRLTKLKAVGMSALAATMMFSTTVPAFAAQAGTITINANSGQSLAGKQFNVYQLFSLGKGAGNAYNYTVNPAYKDILQAVTGKSSDADMGDYIASLGSNTSALRKFSESVRNKIKEKGTAATKTYTAPAGSTTSCSIPVDDMGYYMVDEVTAVAGTHAAASIIMLDTTEPNASINIKSDYPSVTKKIQEDDNNIGWNDIGDYNIGQTIPYKYTTKVPSRIGDYATYKFVFHDKADSALTMDTNSIKVTIGETAIDKTKYTVNTGTDAGGDTFNITFNDLKTAKASVAAGEEIVVTYNGKINSTAAAKTGRPGYENKVQLEYSNNPDSDGNGATGKTPWDVVVAFTYKVSGTKISSANDKLANAKFRLYTDSSCTQEVKTAKEGSNYVVGAYTGADIVSDSNGVFNIVGLDGGTYYLKEVAAPTGYKPLTSALKLTITPTFTTDRNSYTDGAGATANVLKTLSATLDTKTLTTDVATGNVSVTVTNKKGVKLPVTGSAVTAIMVTAGGAFMIAAVRRKKSEDAE